jgi:hypothetical protein
MIRRTVCGSSFSKNPETVILTVFSQFGHQIEHVVESDRVPSGDSRSISGSKVLIGTLLPLKSARHPFRNLR